MKAPLPLSPSDATSVVAVSENEDRLVGRTEASSLLGASVSTLRRLEQTTLPPVVDDHGVHLHSVKRVLEYKVQHFAPTPANDDDNGTVASAAFELFDTGLDAADVVKQLKIPPKVARSLQREWADLRGSFVVGGLAASKLERFAWTCEDPQIKTGDDIVRLLAELDRLECESCKRRTPRLCLHCYANRPRSAELVVVAARRNAERVRAEREARAVEENARRRARASLAREQRATNNTDSPPRSGEPRL